MLKRPFGSVRVPVIGQGTWRLRGPEAVETLRTGIELGLTHIDTAELYGTEEMVAEAVEGRRDEVFIVSKVVPSNASRAGTVRACEQSLQRLRTDRLDCYLLHWPGPHPLEDTIAAFEELQAAGKIRSYGVSNFDEDLFAEAARIAGRGRIVYNQVFYNLGERHVEARVIPPSPAVGALLGAAADGRVSAAPDARTVRYYTTLGLLDRPRIEGRQARYAERHLLQLLAIKALQAFDLPLAEIQQRLYGRSDAELKALIESLAAEARTSAASGAQVPSLRLREVAVEPGVRLVVEEGWRLRDPAALEARIRAALAALGGER